MSDTTTTTSTTSSTTTDTTITDTPAVEDLVDAHLAAYCEPDAARRAARVAASWDPQGRLVDPPMEATGHDAIAALTDVVLQHYPAHTFRRTTAVDQHHEFARYGWELVAPDGTVAVNGVDVVRVGADGRLAGIVGFFGDLAGR
jgi:hypothetical protein